jgi:hypothetical protein
MIKYTLKWLMDKKYGADRFALACEIVGRWVRFETKNNFITQEWVEQMACAGELDDHALMPAEAEALRRLFALQSTDQLYT